MGRVIPFPVRPARRRSRTVRTLTPAAALIAVVIAGGGIYHAGRDLLRGSTAQNAAAPDLPAVPSRMRAPG